MVHCRVCGRHTRHIKETEHGEVHGARIERQGRRGSGSRTAGTAQCLQRPAPDVEAHPLERRGTEFHRCARDDRSASGTRPCYADEVAERIAALGDSPLGTPGAIEKYRTWDDYSVARDTAQAHLAALDLVYDGLITDNRKAISKVGKIDAITEDLLIGQTGQLEKFQWFVRAHLENASGTLANADAHTEKKAAKSAR